VDALLSELEIEELALELVAMGSVNGSPGETALVESLAAHLRAHPLARSGALRVELLPSPDDPLGRPVLLACRPGRRRRAVLLMGHIDTVGTGDYLDLEPLALRPRALTQEVAKGALGAAMAELARSGDWLFGRGVLDMKSGVAAIASEVAYNDALRDGEGDDLSPPPMTLFLRDQKPLFCALV
jgi:arginine utilization protein RocB